MKKLDEESVTDLFNRSIETMSTLEKDEFLRELMNDIINAATSPWRKYDPSIGIRPEKDEICLWRVDWNNYPTPSYAIGKAYIDTNGYLIVGRGSIDSVIIGNVHMGTAEDIVPTYFAVILPPNRSEHRPKHASNVESQK